ncbi:hypothetical protein GCM10011519_00570 [Marmoricola endophyticus]|uniref:Uncharacterized protein n=1 Tax=Marmoricola endophyticus TaxID=2040280 RepID=A0A917B8Y3_9ACTN|nr:hypothetical protein [Marmoricola endophyticus]GGF31021.1 hypothetical protein GCM10011519_00570 [Marmoricola endophyticus]
MSETGWRWWGLVALGGVSLLLGTYLVLAGRTDAGAAGDSHGAAVRPPGGTAHDASGALDVLHRWDAARSRAWAAGDVEGLRGLYVDDAPAGARDVAMLRAYLGRGLVVRGLRMQVLDARVRHLDPAVVRLQVTERLAGGVADDAERSRALPRDSTSTRLVELRRAAGRWRVAAVSQA